MLDRRPSPARRNVMTGLSGLPARTCQATRARRCRIWVMPRTDDDRDIRLRPPKPRVARNEGAAWSNGFKLLMHHARSSRKAGNRAPGGKGKGTRQYLQRCAVRVTYLKNRLRGQCSPHGRYRAGETATIANDA